jgi:two-component system, LytTR family, sensor kinase
VPHIKTAPPIVLGSGRTISKSTLFNALHYGGWFAFGSMWFVAGVSTFGPLPQALNNLSWIACGSVLTLGFRQVYRRVLTTRLPYALRGFLALLLSMLGAPVWYIVDMALNRTLVSGLVQLNGIGPLFLADAQKIASSPWLMPVGHWITFGSTLFIWSSLYVAINTMLDLEMERERVVRALQLADSARLSVLQTQLNPHFLFNALNGISTLIRDRDDIAAASMIDTLSDFLRSMLQKIESPEIAVAEELAFVEHYLQIQRFRFGGRLRAHVCAEPETLGALIPTLILQPLVENAVRHGVLTREEGGSVSVAIQRREGLLVVSVEDDGPGLMSVGGQSFGVGLANSAERLEALYGEDAQMYIGPRPQGKGFAVILRLPFRQAPERQTSSARVAMAV